MGWEAVEVLGILDAYIHGLPGMQYDTQGVVKQPVLLLALGTLSFQYTFVARLTLSHCATHGATLCPAAAAI